MTDAQLFTLAVAIILPLSLLLYSNSRITEAKETIIAKMQTLEVTVQAGIADLRKDMTAEFASVRKDMAIEFAGLRKDVTVEIKALDTKLVIHELEHHK